ncbi:hypothetical protein [Halalkalibacter akibai]|uniref:Uncharacterized protein n=1 Tax=Halalkalibacter akibai (strain ATCC 43226 / DSM 21942 / CIP 109018 / JCM 9157 / 1139) TaxID=1236973 RepID=W4QTM4_HALA3|nr:hypothetical protein [Halalkalibacter akibai]GAE35411.1 hypothetical protein JCM9157_2515 [Halalkalibacter akibai JCM 9157]
MIDRKRMVWVKIICLAIAGLVLTGCGGNDQSGDGDLTLLNEEGEQVSLTNKERATILFHFTEVG